MPKMPNAVGFRPDRTGCLVRQIQQAEGKFFVSVQIELAALLGLTNVNFSQDWKVSVQIELAALLGATH